MRLVSWIIMVPVALAVIAFSVSNRGVVALDFWPLPFVSEQRLSVIVLAGVFVGFVLGGLVAWISGGRTRRRARAMARRAEAAEVELARLRDTVTDLEAAAARRKTALPAPTDTANAA